MKRALIDRLAEMLGRKPPGLQVAALCRDAGGRVLLVTSRGTGRWVLPKGWPMAGRRLAEAALQEAWEEAGVRGRVHPDPIGRYDYGKDQDEGFSLPVEVHVFAVEVDRLADDWPEAAQRRRAWFPPARAAELVAESGLRALLRGLDPSDEAAAPRLPPAADAARGKPGRGAKGGKARGTDGGRADGRTPAPRLAEGTEAARQARADGGGDDAGGGPDGAGGRTPAPGLAEGAEAAAQDRADGGDTDGGGGRADRAGKKARSRKGRAGEGPDGGGTPGPARG